MELQFKTVPAKRCPKKDVIAALEIYCKSVDHGSLTDTNQIKDYIWNTKQHANEERIMFFYLLYGQNNDVLGFSEFAYLPENKVLVLERVYTRLTQSFKYAIIDTSNTERSIYYGKQQSA